MPLAADGVAVVLREAARDISACYKCRFSLWMVPSQHHENWVSLWCRSSKWWAIATERFLTLIVFDGEEGGPAHLSGTPRNFIFSDLSTFRVALREYFASPECGQVMRDVLDFGRKR